MYDITVAKELTSLVAKANEFGADAFANRTKPSALS